MPTTLKDCSHIPVLLNEVLDCLQLKCGFQVIDATLGLGGHTKAIAEKIGKKGKIYAFEQDEENLLKAKENLKNYLDRIVFFDSNFSRMKECIGLNKVDAILFDLGVSSTQLDNPKRGFSFRFDAALDMRMDLRKELTAEKIVNEYDEKSLREIFWIYGEEKKAGLIARAIIEKRKIKRIETTFELKEIIYRFVRRKKKGIDPATKIFQALRMEVNDEISVLKDALSQAFDLLKKDGRLAVISFHSGEDRIVKNFFRYWESPDVAMAKVLTKKPIIPSAEEIALNSRARSARLRSLQKI